MTAVAVLPEPTGRVDVTVDLAGHASYVFAPACAWDNVPWSDSLERLAAAADLAQQATLRGEMPGGLGQDAAHQI